MKNEKGSALVLVLLMTLVFIVLGLGLVTQVVTETNLSVQSEKKMQARNLAESGLVYFEEDVKKYIESEERDINEIKEFIEGYHKDVIGTDDESEQAKIVEVTLSDNFEKDYTFFAVSLGKVDDDVKLTLVGEYKLGIDINADFDEKRAELASFSNARGLPFNHNRLLGVSLLPEQLLNLDLIKWPSSSKKFIPVPADTLLDVNLLGGALRVPLLQGERFKTAEDSAILATQQTSILGVNLLKSTLSINLLTYEVEDPTNVLINGYYPGISILWGLIEFNDGFKDIEFKKLAVLGSANFHRHKDDKSTYPRYFSFRDGLYVYDSLYITAGEDGGRSSLGLAGEMLAHNGFLLSDTDLLVGSITNGKYAQAIHEENRAGELSVYVYDGDVHIQNSCISIDEAQGYKFNILTKGNIVFENRPSCNEYPGFYYSEKTVEFKTGGHQMIIDGMVLADEILVDGKPYTGEEENFEIRNNYHLETVSYDLISKGREMRK